jgi:tetratricopeptide (TPR) repeat protein
LVQPGASHNLKAERPFLWKRTMFWVGVLGAAVGAGFSAKPLYREGKAWRARRLSLEVERYVGEGRVEEAMERARRAYQLKPDEPAAMRAVARVEGAAGRQPSAIAFWKQLLEVGGMQPADRKHWVEDLLKAGAVGAAQQELAFLLKAAPQDGQLLRLAAQAAMAEGKKGVSLKHAEQAVKVDPANPEGRLILGLILGESHDASIRGKGMALLSEVARGPGKAGLDALSVLSRWRDLPEQEAEALSALARVHPLANAVQRLWAVDFKLAMHPEQGDELMEAELKRVVAGDAESRRALGVWFNARGEFDRALRAVPLEEAMKRKDVLLVHLDALAALKRWKDVVSLLERREVPLDEVYREIFLARSATESGEKSIADLHWRRAHLAVGVSYEQAWFIAGYAERMGCWEQAEIAYRNLSSRATSARPAYEALLRLAERQGDASKVRGVLEKMRERWPADTAVENDLAYFSLLLNRDVGEALQSAKRLVVGAPNSLPHRTTLALALLRSGNVVEALRVYDGLNIPWGQVALGQQAVYVAVVSANGRREDAAGILRTLDPAKLRKEEARLLEGMGTPLSAPALRKD